MIADSVSSPSAANRRERGQIDLPAPCGEIGENVPSAIVLQNGFDRRGRSPGHTLAVPRLVGIGGVFVGNHSVTQNGIVRRTA